MACFWIGFNHHSFGPVKVKPRRRLSLELVSFVLVLITWCFTISGIVTLSDSGTKEFVRGINYYTGNLIKTKGTECAASVPGGCEVNFVRAVGSTLFVAFNTIYTIVTFIFVVLNIIYRKEYLKMGQKPLVRNTEWAERKGRQFCCDICTPCNALRMFHHLEHRGAFVINLACAIMGVELYFSIPLTLLTLAQTIISYFYAEDIALCGFGICCAYLLFVRRYPQEELDALDMGQTGEKREDTLNV
eukprot:GFUD01005692.1.p1 GENE.GFUD01005692.1~~GFUD01005692.1.p1  ORF type:complete len:245 (-),score=46.20 GFUD01005692.1:71-805(-)